jgi:PAS domain-containing protein
MLFMGVSIFVIGLNERLRRARARSDERLGELTRLQEQLSDAKGEAERARDLLQMTLASIGDGVIATDAEGRVTFLNKVAEDLTGLSRRAGGSCQSHDSRPSEWKAHPDRG